MEHMTLSDFCALTASEAPAPGGGSVSALAGALAAALAEMVAGLTAGRREAGLTAAECAEAAEALGALRRELLEDVARDSQGFQAYMAALKLPRDTPEQQRDRHEAMQAALRTSAEIPLGAARRAAAVLPWAEKMVRRGNPNAVTDGLVSAMLARTAVLGAVYNVKINLASLQDAAYTEALRREAEALAAEAEERERRIRSSAAL